MKKPNYIDNVKHWSDKLKAIQTEIDDAFAVSAIMGYTPENEAMRQKYRDEIDGLVKGDQVYIVSVEWHYKTGSFDRDYRVKFVDSHPGLHEVSHVTKTSVCVFEDGKPHRWNRNAGSSAHCGAYYNRHVGRRSYYIVAATKGRKDIHDRYQHAKEKLRYSKEMENELLRDYVSAKGIPTLHTFGPFAVMSGSFDGRKQVRSYHCVGNVWKGYFGPDDMDDDAESTIPYSMFRVVAASIPYEKRLEMIRLIVSKIVTDKTTAIALRNRNIRKGLVEMMKGMDDEDLVALIGIASTTPHKSEVTDEWLSEWNGCQINQPFDLGYDHQQTI